MEIWELVVIAAGLAMDAFAVAVCKGLSTKKIEARHGIVVGLYFGGFQAIMPLLGYLLGSSFQSLIQNIDHWIAFGLLLIIGVNMLRESRSGGECLPADFSPKAMLPMAVATSIDALAVGITFAFLRVKIVPAVCLIGGITFVMSIIGLKLGNLFGAKYKQAAEIVGGMALILIGTKILLEHLGVLG